MIVSHRRLEQIQAKTHRSLRLGNKALSRAKVDEMQSNLKETSPKPFDITRKMHLYASRVQYVEFSVSNYQLNDPADTVASRAG